MEGTDTGHENGEAMASVGVRLNAQLGAEFPPFVLCFIVEFAASINPVHG